MDLQIFDDCDAEVFAYFPENIKELKAFTCSPKRCGLIKPIPVRLEPPYPWDCGISYTRNSQMTSKRSSAFMTVLKRIDNETAQKHAGDQKEQPHHISSKDTQLTLDSSNKSSTNSKDSSPVSPFNDSFQERLASELEIVRAELQTAKLHGKTLEQKNRKLQTRIGKYKADNLTLRTQYENLVEESERLKVEMTRLRLGLGYEQVGRSGDSEETALKNSQLGGSWTTKCTIVEGRSNHNYLNGIVSGCRVQTNSSGDFVSSKKEAQINFETVNNRKKNKKTSVLKQLKKAFKRMTT